MIFMPDLGLVFFFSRLVRYCYCFFFLFFFLLIFIADFIFPFFSSCFLFKKNDTPKSRFFGGPRGFLDKFFELLPFPRPAFTSSVSLHHEDVWAYNTNKNQYGRSSLFFRLLFLFPNTTPFFFSCVTTLFSDWLSHLLPPGVQFSGLSPFLFLHSMVSPPFPIFHF